MKISNFWVAFGLVNLLSFLGLGSRPTRADEGMWTYDNFPAAKVKQSYGFAPDAAWLNHLRDSSVRLARGCSGSIVSPTGLVMTNHHCAHSCIEQLSTGQKDFIASGFYAKAQADEIKCPDVEINQLKDITDVTARINQATAGLSDNQFNQTLKAEMSKIEAECAGADHLRCDVVTLYNGGQYHLYRYRRFQDARLVFAPELAAAFFGGDPDNFNFPRYDLDVSFFRIYQDGKPANTASSYLRWSKQGAQESDLAFVSGHPGGTSRLLTVAELAYRRDVALPSVIERLSELRGLLTEFQNRGTEQKRFSGALLFTVENSLKANKGRFQALTEATFFAKKMADEKSLRTKVESNPEWRKKYGSAWDAISKAQNDLKQIRKPLNYIEQGQGFQSDLFAIARALVRSADELPKPNGKRLREYADSALPTLKQKLFSSAPIYPELEIATLTFSLGKLVEELGPDDPLVKKIFGKQSPRELANQLIRGTALKDLALRQSLFSGGKKAVAASQDPMLLFAQRIDADARSIRKQFEDNIESVLKKNSEKIAHAQFEAIGTHTYPDATFTLRLSYGQVKGYPENGKTVSPLTHFAGAFERDTGKDPFALPESWLKAKPQLDLSTPLNFASTNDIIGGNSGSPVVNRNAEVIGLIFDSNIYGLASDFGYSETQSRAVSVHSAGILEALEKVYRANRLVTEIKQARN